MNIINRNKSYILILMINLMFTFSIVVQSYKIMDFNYLPLIAVFALVSIIYFLFNYIITKPIYKVLFFFIIVILALAYVLLTGVAVDLYYQASNNVYDITNAIKNNQITYYEQYSIFFMFFIPILVVFFYILADNNIFNPIIIFTTSVMILFWYLGFTKIVEANILSFLFITLVTFGVNSCASYSKKLLKVNIQADFNSVKILSFAIIPALIIAFLVINLPRQFDTHYLFTIKGNIFKNGDVSSAKAATSESVGLSESGYTDITKRLGGALQVNDQLALKVKADSPKYLKGSIEDTYNGFQWGRSNEGYNVMVGNGEFIPSINFYFGTGINSMKTMTIYPENKKIKALFTPIYTYSADVGNADMYYKAPTFTADLSAVDKYDINYFDVGDDEFVENNKALFSRNGWNYNDATKAQYINYLQVSDTITQRTKDLLNNIVGPSDNNYEKVTKIKHYLESNFTYNLKVSDLPANQDFLDYFLFTEKKGYCVYFATAATMLCRMEGIPARYVEGFKMPDTKDSQGLYLVTNKQAHAWCEVLIDPETDLWATLETTPATVESSTTSIVVTPTPIVKPTPPTVSNTEQTSSIKATGNTNSSKFKLTILNVVLFFIVLVLSALVGKIIYVKIKIKNLLKKQSVIPLYLFSAKRLRSVGVTKSEFMGDLEFIKTIEDITLRRALGDMVKSSYGEFYGNNVNININIDFNKKKTYQEIEVYIRDRKKWWIYYVKKYLFV